MIAFLPTAEVMTLQHVQSRSVSFLRDRGFRDLRTISGFVTDFLKDQMPDGRGIHAVTENKQGKQSNHLCRKRKLIPHQYRHYRENPPVDVEPSTHLFHHVARNQFCTKRWLSTSANAPCYEDDYENDDIEETRAISDQRRQRGDRPRLNALKKLLQKEDLSKMKTDSSEPSIRNSVSRESIRLDFGNKKSGSKPNQPWTSNSPDRVDPAKKLRALRQWVESLPDLPADNKEAVLTDRFHRRHTYLRLSLTERCNLRCTYCMPENGVPLQPSSHLLQTSELLQLAGYFRQHGVSKFRLTGGEPTLRKDLLDIVQGLSELAPEQIGMTTNGITLAPKLSNLAQAGLNSINLSLDTLQHEKFGQLTRRPGNYLNKVWKTLETCQDLSSAITFKINCVVMRDINTDEIADFVRLTQLFPNASVRFIEYMPFTQNGWNGQKLVPYRELLQQLQSQHGIELIPTPSNDPSDTTKYYATPWATSEFTGTAGKIGFITSMSNHFCGTCNRLRLTADGQLKVCLFDGKTELSLRDALRSGFTNAELSKAIHAAVQQKHYKLGGHVDPTAIAKDADTNRPMTLIGG